MTLRVLVGCERHAKVRDAFRTFRKRGHDAWSCDLLETTGDPRWHIKGDVFDVLDDDWDIGIFFYTCTYLCSSGLHWNKRRPERAEKTEQDVRRLLNAPIERVALENPRGCIGSRIRKADQIIQPYQFGHDASKETHLWLQGLPPLKIHPAKYVKPRLINGRPRWGNQTDSGQNNLPPSQDRWDKRSETYQGIADAMADWGDWVLETEWNDPFKRLDLFETLGL